MARQLSKTQVRRAIEIGGERLNALALAEVEARTRDDFVRVIWNLWEDARQRFLLIGRYLNRAREALSHGEWGEMVRNDLPFSVAVADQFRTIAKAVDDGTFTVAELPQHYSVAYQLVTLRPEEAIRARQEGLLRPNVRRDEVMAFKKRLRVAVPTNTAQPRVSRDRLKAERERLLARLREIDDLLAEDNDISDVTPAEGLSA
jgi:hypothetical protein